MKIESLRSDVGAALRTVEALTVAAALLAAVACAGGDAESESAVPAAVDSSADAGGAEPATPSAPEPPRRLYSLDAGTSLTVELAQDVTSDTVQTGDPVTARVRQPISVDGQVVIPAGASVRGKVAEVKPAKRFGGQAMVRIEFASLMLPSGEAVVVEGSLAAHATKQTGKDAGAIAGGTAGGALLGKVLGGDDKDAAIGGVVGGAIGTAIASRKGDEAFLPMGSEAVIVTAERVSVTGAG